MEPPSRPRAAVFQAKEENVYLCRCRHDSFALNMQNKSVSKAQVSPLLSFTRPAGSP